jgi:hypothetical protein
MQEAVRLLWAFAPSTGFDDKLRMMVTVLLKLKKKYKQESLAIVVDGNFLLI